MAAAGVPPQVVDGLRPGERSGSFDFSQLTGVGDMGAAILAAIPAQFQAAVAPFIDADRRGHPRGVQPRDRPDLLARRGRRDRGARIAAVAIKEIPLRTSNAAPVPAQADGGRRRPGTPSPAGTLGRIDDRLTRAPPHARRPGGLPAGSFHVRALRLRRDDRPDAPAPFPPRLRALRRRHRRDAVRGASSTVADLPPGAMRRVTPRRPRHPARPHAGRDRRDRRPLPAHERAAVDRRARRLRRRLSAPRGPVRPVLRRPGPDADDRRPRPGRRLPPDLVAGRPRAEGGPARARRPRRAG